MLKKLLVLGLFSSLLLSACGQKEEVPEIPSEVSFACNYPNFDQVEFGMTKEEVQQLMGVQAVETLRGEVDELGLAENIFVNPNIEGFWFYALDQSQWGGTIEIYFDTEGKVVGKNCGYA